MIEPGQTCPNCERRVPYPKKGDSPKSRVKSMRIPADEAEAFAHNLARAALVVGITSEHKYPIYRFLEFMVDTVLVDEDAWAGAYLRAYSGEGAG